MSTSQALRQKDVDGRRWVALAILVVGLANTADAQPGKSSADAATRQFTVAKALQARQQFELAAEEWAKFLKNHASDARAGEAQYNLGVCRFQDKKYAEAAAAFVQVITDHPKSKQQAGAWLHLGLAQYNQAAGGQPEFYAKAADNLASYLKKFPEGAEAAKAAFFLGEALYASGKKPEAVEAYAQVVEKYPKDPLLPEALYALGVTQEELGQTAAAGASYDAYLKRFPSAPQAAELTLRRGDTLLAQKQYDAAAKWYAAAASRPGFADADLALFQQATALSELRQYGEAAKVYASIAQKFPQSKQVQPAQLAAGKCAYLAGDLDRAREQLTKSLASGGAVAAEAAHWLARGYLKQRKPEEALKVVEAALPGAAQTPFAAQLELDRANAMYEQPARRRDSVAAFAEIAGKFAKDPLAPQALYLAAFAALNVGDYAKAFDYSDRFMKQFTNHELAADVEYITAETNLQLGKHNAAIAAYDRLLKSYPQRPDVPAWRVRRGLALFFEKKFADVVTSLEPLLPTLTDKAVLAEASYVVGSSQNELKQYESALGTLSAGLAAEPHGRYAADTLLALALAERRLNKTAQARQHLQQVITEFADQPVLDRAHFRLAEDAYAGGDSSTAQAEYKLVVEKFPNSPLAPKALLGMAWVQIAAGDFTGAVTNLDMLLAKYANSDLTPRARYARGLAREELKQFAPALDDVRAFLQTNPTGDEKSDARYVLGVCQAGLNQFEEAAQTFRSILDEDPRYIGGDKVLYELAWTLKSLDRGEQAVEAFRRLAKEHTASPLAAEALCHVGETEYEAGRYAPAATAFHESMQRAGKTTLGEKAAYMLGRAQFRQNAFDKARQTFAYQRATWPQGSLTDDAAFMEAESLFKQSKYADALPLYQQVKKPSGKDFAALAMLHAAQAQAQLKQWQASLATLAQATRQFSDSEHLPEMLCEEAWAKQNLRQTDEALKLYEEVTAKSEAEVAARARFLIGEIYFEKKNHTEAIRNFFKAAYGYGYPRWQANAHYEAGRCFEELGKTDLAVKSYQEVTEHFPDSNKAALAKGRLNALTTGK